MHALGSYQGGWMLFLRLGTRIGSAMMFEDFLGPMELARLPYKKGRSYEDYVGAAALERQGKENWRHRVNKIIQQLKTALESDYVVLEVATRDYLRSFHPVRAAETMPMPSKADTACGQRLTADLLMSDSSMKRKQSNRPVLAIVRTGISEPQTEGELA